MDSHWSEDVFHVYGVAAISKLSMMASGFDSFLCDQTDALRFTDDPSVKCIQCPTNP